MLETEDIEVMLDLLGVEANEPLPDTELVRSLKALAELYDIDEETLS